MSSTSKLPMAVLSERLADAIGSRRVRVAVFTTFNFDPGFFELHVLPVLFDQSFSQVDKIRLLQLEDALRSIDQLAVYYDRGALAQDAEPARLDYRRLDVRRSTGAFHPKLILLLVDESHDDRESSEQREKFQSLIIAAQSANITRAGWWENVECAHLEEIKDRDLADERCAYRRDLLAILRRIERCSESDEGSTALETIRRFLLTRTSKHQFTYARSGGHFHTRLFGGESRKSLAGWLGDLGLGRKEWNVEIISPYFDPGGAGPLESLASAVNAREVRVYLPRAADGTALVKEKTYRTVAEYATWSTLATDVLDRGRGAGGERLAPRRVHAKVYRIWRSDGPDLVLIGSVNLTESGHSHGAAGNLEAAFFVDVSSEGWPRRWWLKPIDEDAKRFVEEAPDEADGLDPVPVDVSFRFDWGTGQLAYRIGFVLDGPLHIRDIAGIDLFELQNPESDNWTRCADSSAEKMREHLRSSSFVVAHHGGRSWRVLVREENMAHRPSLLADLTPEEILEYWSLLTPEQRAAFLEERAAFGLDLEGIPVAVRAKLDSRDTLFDRFAGLYHAFGCLERQVETALEEGRTRDAETRLFGAKYDSLPELLEKTLEAPDGDPVLSYVTYLTAAQLASQVRRHHKSFYRECGARTGRLEALLAMLPVIRDRLPLDDKAEGRAFLEWFEPAFLGGLKGLRRETSGS